MRDYDIESDLKQEKFQSIKLVQGDRGNKIKINVYEDGQPVNLAGCSVTAKYKRVDGEIINDGVIENIHDNSFDAVMDSSITKVAGTLKMLFTIEKDAVKVSAFLLLADVREGIGESSSSGGSAGGGEVTVDLTDYYKKIETYSRKEIDAQFKDIANKVENVSSANLINQNGGGALKIWAGTKVEYDNLLVKNEDTVYLVEGSGGGSTTVTTYTITNNLTNCKNSNTNASVNANSSYTATITADTGYRLNTTTITMGGNDITSTAYTNGSIFIESVTGDIVITASATESGEGTDTSEVTWSFGTTDNAGNVSTASDSVVSSKIAVQPSATYYITVSPIGTATVPIVITEYDSSKNYVTRTLNKYTVTTNASTSYITIDIRGGVTSLDNITINITDKIEHDKPVYTLENELTLDGTGTGIVDTKKGLFDADRDFTIFADFTPDGSMTQIPDKQQVIFRVKQTNAPWIGVDIALFLADASLDNPNQTRGSMAIQGYKNGIYLGKMVTGISSNTTDRCKFVIKRVASEQKLYFYDKQGLIGSYNDAGTVSSNLFNTTVIIGYGNGLSSYFKGTIHQFKIWYDAINDNDITSMLV